MEGGEEVVRKGRKGMCQRSSTKCKFEMKISREKRWSSFQSPSQVNLPPRGSGEKDDDGLLDLSTLRRPIQLDDGFIQQAKNAPLQLFTIHNIISNPLLTSRSTSYQCP